MNWSDLVMGFVTGLAIGFVFYIWLAAKALHMVTKALDEFTKSENKDLIR